MNILGLFDKEIRNPLVTSLFQDSMNNYYLYLSSSVYVDPPMAHTVSRRPWRWKSCFFPKVLWWTKWQWDSFLYEYCT